MLDVLLTHCQSGVGVIIKEKEGEEEEGQAGRRLGAEKKLEKSGLV